MANKGMSVFTNNGEDFTINDPNIANEFDPTVAYRSGEYVNYQGNLCVFISDHPAGAWNASHVKIVKIGKEVSDLKNAFSNSMEVSKTNVSQNNAGTSAFLCFFDKPTYIIKMKPRFIADGTFRWGIYTADKNISDPSARGTTVWKETVSTGSEILLDKEFATNEGIVIQAIYPAAIFGGLLLDQCEFSGCCFAQMNVAYTYVDNYYNYAYGFPATFTYYNSFDELKDEVFYSNESNGTTGSHAPFGAIFTTDTYIDKIIPLFASQGTFRIGIYTPGSGTVWKSATYQTGDIVPISQTIETGHGIVVETFGNAYIRNGVPDEDVRFANTDFAMFNSDASSIINKYEAYGFPAVFIVPGNKDIASKRESGDAVIIHPSGTLYNTGEIIYGIDKAIEDGTNHLILTGGTFNITDSIRVPNDFILEIKNATIKLAQNAKCNIIISKNVDDLSAGQNIIIKGENAILDGNYSQQSGLSDGSYKRIGLLMFNVDGFEISGITLKNTHAWGMSCESGCANGKIHDIVIDQDGGSANQDGIDIRGGCHDIEIYNITGFSDDDLIACTALLGNVLQVMNTGANGKDIYNIVIHDVKGESGYCNIVDLICHDTCKTHDITIYNIVDNAPDGKTFVMGGGAYSHTLKIGNYDFTSYAISGTPGTVDDMYNIKAFNIVSNSKHGLGLGWACKKVDIHGITMKGNVTQGISVRDMLDLSFQAKEIVIGNVFAEGGSQFYPVYVVNGTMENCIFKDFTINQCYDFLKDDGNGMSYTNVSFLYCNLFGGQSLYYLSNESAPYFDSFYIPSASAFTDLYPETHQGLAVIGNNMPYRN